MMQIWVLPLKLVSPVLQ